MSDSMMAQMLKLGLVSPEAAQKSTAKNSPPKGSPQRTPAPQGSAPKPSAAPAPRTKEGAPQGGPQGAQQADHAEPIDREAALAALASASPVPSGEGGRRFYYEARDGRVPYLNLAEEVHRGLTEGGMALVETEAGAPRLLPAEAAGRLSRAWPALVRVWRR